MTRLKKLIKYSLSVVLIMAVWIFANSFDDPSYDDLGILSKLKQVPDNKNGYSVIRYLDESSNNIFEKDVIDRIILHVKDKEWDQAFVNQVLRDHSSHLDDIEVVIQKPYFKFPEGNSAYYIPSYLAIINVSRLLIIKSKNQAQKGDINAAIKTIKSALKFGQKIKTEENATLISHMIGWAMHHEQIRWVHFLSLKHNLSIEHLTKLGSALNIIPPYQNDGFKKLIYGEYKFLARSVEEERKESFIQWWKEFGSKLGVWHSFKVLLHTLFTDYYFHPNEFLTELAPRMIELADQSPKVCEDISYISNSWNSSWFDIFLPNSITNESIKSGTEIYKVYFSRRCVSYTYLNAIKAIFAIQKYKIANVKIPDSLEILVPKFIEREPADYFDGRKLTYSKESGHLYSGKVNLNAESDPSGDVDECYTGDECIDNFSIQISPGDNSASDYL